MTAGDLDDAYTCLCQTMAQLGEPNANLFLARLAMLAIARLDDAAAAKQLIAAAAAARCFAVDSSDVSALRPEAIASVLRPATAPPAHI